MSDNKNDTATPNIKLTDAFPELDRGRRDCPVCAAMFFTECKGDLERAERWANRNGRSMGLIVREFLRACANADNASQFDKRVSLALAVLRPPSLLWCDEEHADDAFMLLNQLIFRVSRFELSELRLLTSILRE